MTEPTAPLIIQPANREEHHRRICAMARTSPYTRDFGSIMFSSEAAYEKGWIRIGVVGRGIVAFTCVRHKTRSPETKLYFITVQPEYRGLGIGQQMMGDLEEQTPHRRIVLDVAKTNEDARRFYERLGYVVVSENGIRGTAWTLAKEW